MRLTVNGEPREAADGETVATLLARLALDTSRVAVELNGRLARRADHAGQGLREGDRLEIVRFVGGG